MFGFLLSKLDVVYVKIMLQKSMKLQVPTLKIVVEISGAWNHMSSPGLQILIPKYKNSIHHMLLIDSYILNHKFQAADSIKKWYLSWLIGSQSSHHIPFICSRFDWVLGFKLSVSLFKNFIMLDWVLDDFRWGLSNCPYQNLYIKCLIRSSRIWFIVNLGL